MALGAESDRGAPVVRSTIRCHSVAEHNPERCGLAPENEWFPGELRQLLYGKRRGVYRILFEVRDTTVYILRVRHGARKLLEPDTW